MAVKEALPHTTANLIQNSYNVMLEREKIKMKTSDMERLFGKSLERIFEDLKVKFCNTCDDTSEEVKIIKFSDCSCTICTNCLAGKIREVTEELVVLNDFEINSNMFSTSIECACGKRKEHKALTQQVFPSFKEYERQAFKRFIFDIENHCFVCHQKIRDSMEVFTVNDLLHRMCDNCVKKVKSKESDEKVVLYCHYCKEQKHNLTLLMFMKNRKKKEKTTSCTKCYIF